MIPKQREGSLTSFPSKSIVEICLIKKISSKEASCTCKVKQGALIHLAFTDSDRLLRNEYSSKVINICKGSSFDLIPKTFSGRYIFGKLR